MKMEKKKIIFIVIATLIILFASGSMIYSSIVLNKNQKELDKRLVELTLPELQDKVKNKDTFILVYTQTECGHCANYKPKLKKILLENDLTAYEISLDKLSKIERSELNQIANPQDNGTPTTIFIKEGTEARISSRLVGNQEEHKIKEKLIEQGFIKE